MARFLELSRNSPEAIHSNAYAIITGNLTTTDTCIPRTCRWRFSVVAGNQELPVRLFSLYLLLLLLRWSDQIQVSSSPSALANAWQQQSIFNRFRKLGTLTPNHYQSCTTLSFILIITTILHSLSFRTLPNSRAYTHQSDHMMNNIRPLTCALDCLWVHYIIAGEFRCVWERLHDSSLRQMDCSKEKVDFLVHYENLTQSLTQP